MYCAHCGNALPDQAVAEDHADETAAIVSADVEIAKINADRDIQLAKINARAAESEIVADAAVAEAAAESAIETAIVIADALNPAPEAEIAPPVIIDAPADAEPEIAPPPPAGEHDDAPKAERKRRVGLGVW